MKYINKFELNKLPLLYGKNNGFYGTCYKYSDDLVLKIFNTNLYFKRKDEIKSNVGKLFGIEIDNVSFSYQITKTSGIDFSYLMPYIKGNIWQDILYMIKDDEMYDVSFEDISKCYHDGVSKVNKIGKNNIKIFDLNPSNCKIDSKNNFGIFDVDLYKRESYFTKKEIEYHNIREFNNVFNFLFQSIYYIYLKNEEIILLNEFFDILNISNINSVNYVDHIIYELNKKMNVNSIRELTLYK